MTARSNSFHGKSREHHGETGSREALDAVATSAISLARQATQPPRRISVRHGDTSVEIEWDDATIAGKAVTAPAGSATAVTVDPGVDSGADAGLAYICSPVVGTFYHAAEPGAKPFVAVGDIVEPGTQVGIVEAMKLMNAIEADYAGEVVELCVPNAAAVEFQQRLIAIAPIDLQR